MRKEDFSYCDMYVFFAVPFSLEEGMAFVLLLLNSCQEIPKGKGTV